MSVENQILAAITRVEEKLDTLLAALAEDEETQETLSLDGLTVNQPRDESQPL